MNQHRERGILLYQQSRYKMAIDELGQALLDDPHDDVIRVHLAMCHLELQQFDDAEREAGLAIAAAPENPQCHWALGQVLLRRNRLPEAQAAAREALRLDPESADAHALLAAVLLERRDFTGALRHAESGLAADPTHTACSALRSVALMQSRRSGDALEETANALRRDPENDLAHVGRGWALLHANQPKEALASFREALRLDPTSEWARQGMIEALKARYWIYRQFLKYLLWMSTLPGKVQFGLIVAIFLLQNALGRLAQQPGGIQSVAKLVFWCLIAFVLASWIARPLFNLTLMINRFGRFALSTKEKRQAVAIGVLLLIGSSFLIVNLFSDPHIDILAGLAALIAMLLLVPVSRAIELESGRRLIMSVFAMAVLCSGLIAINEYHQGFTLLNEAVSEEYEALANQSVEKSKSKLLAAASKAQIARNDLRSGRDWVQTLTIVSLISFIYANFSFTIYLAPKR